MVRKLKLNKDTLLALQEGSLSEIMGANRTPDTRCPCSDDPNYCPGTYGCPPATNTCWCTQTCPTQVTCYGWVCTSHVPCENTRVPRNCMLD